ncbi:nicotinate phosphoribosyltransferase [Geothrix alkalitolerans]|uniref:nicotinate phosphoribosyltransferase n=1 Tax=Geothrix alkalitolerans TaxID=2922724 RepID=UPI001FAF54CA|nr:nicotinate phosphoribosyltransferase [Geothrix alkalitolerans]
MLTHTENNLILDTDSYKTSHWLQFPPSTTGMFSYLESRGGRDTETVFFGLQYLLKRYLTQRITPDMVREADHFLAQHGVPFNRAGWMRIAHELGGRLPVRIRAVPEGTVVPTHQALMTVESTDAESFWIVSWLETLLMRVWYPTTVATNSHHIKKLIHRYLVETADNPEAELPFKLHDFGSRGVSSQESAAIGGAAHLVNFQGSDTIVGVRCANDYYNHPMSGFSIPAAEHSTITAWGREGEAQAYANMLARFAKPGSVVAVVSDSYDLWNALELIWGEELRERVIESGATVVLRPDSGHPATVVHRALEVLESKFGVTTNAKGYKVLNNVRVIQGDGINRDSILEILEVAKQHGYSATNIAFGMGGGLLQQLDRDTQKFAYKCSSVTVDGVDRDVFKAPSTDPAKSSRRGKLDLIQNGDYFQTLPYTKEPYSNSALHLVYENGEILHQWTMDQVRELAW